MKHRPLALLATLLLLAGCATESPRKIFLLGDPAQTSAPSRIDTGLPVIELARVALPDYLDSTDMVRRGQDQELIVSVTGRWGERLSLAISDALIPTLSRLLPNAVVTSHSEARPERRLAIEIERFDIAVNGDCVIAARWRFISGDGRTTQSRAAASFRQTTIDRSDQAMAAAMTLLLDQLAVQIAAGGSASLPVLIAANDPAKPPPRGETRAAAQSECGGPPIQDGHDVQPTPAHDKCLADKEGGLRQDQPEKSPRPQAKPPPRN